MKWDDMAFAFCLGMFGYFAGTLTEWLFKKLKMRFRKVNIDSSLKITESLDGRSMSVDREDVIRRNWSVWKKNLAYMPKLPKIHDNEDAKNETSKS